MTEQPYIIVSIERLSIDEEYHTRTEIEADLESHIIQLLEERFSGHEHCEFLNITTPETNVHAEVHD